MGNCQAIDAAVLVIQHPDGKLEKMYWSVSASEVMKKNPDHYVSLILSLPEESDQEETRGLKSIKSHVKLLRSSDTLNLGSAYRLVPSKEVLNVLRANKSARMSKRQVSDKNASEAAQGLADTTTSLEDIFKATGKRSRPVTSRKPSMRRSKSWHPSLMTIAEIPSQ